MHTICIANVCMYIIILCLYVKFKFVLLLVVSPHQSDPLFDTVLRSIIIIYSMIRYRAFLLQQWVLVKMIHRMVCFFTVAQGIIIVYIYIHVSILCLLHGFVPSMLRHLDSDHVTDAPLARNMLGVCIIVWCSELGG